MKGVAEFCVLKFSEIFTTVTICNIIILPAVVAVMLGSLGQNSIFHIYGTFVFERNLTRLDPKFRTSQRPIRLERWSQNVVMLKNKKNIA